MSGLNWLARIAGVTLMAAGVLAGCSGPESSGHTLESGKSLMLMFQETEPGIDPYATRVLVNDAYVRMDNGGGHSDFVLYDRERNTIYSVMHSDRSVLVVQGKPVLGESPIAIEMDADKDAHPDAPEVSGQQPVQYTLKVNDKACSKVMVVPGLLQEGVVALREFRRALAGQHSENLPKTPKEMLDPCFVAYHIFAPVQHLQYGFPIQQWDTDGVSRALVDYNKSFDTDPALFKLPEGYRRMGIGPGGMGNSANGEDTPQPDA